MALVNAPIERICIENPIGIMSTLYRKPKPPHGQIVQPYNFGDDASKATCLWLKGLLLLEPTKYIEPRIVTINGKQYKRWASDSGQNRLGPSPTRLGRIERGPMRGLRERWPNSGVDA